MAFWFPSAHVGAVGGRPAGRALAHVVQNRVEAACARSDLFERRRLLINDWAEYLGEERGQVVTLRR